MKRSKLVNSLRNFESVVTKTKPAIVHHLCLDIPNIISQIYESCHDSDEKGQVLLNRIDEVIRLHRPQKSIFLSFEGINSLLPLAKLGTKRRRNFQREKTAAEAQKKEKGNQKAEEHINEIENQKQEAQKKEKGNPKQKAQKKEKRNQKAEEQINEIENQKQEAQKKEKGNQKAETKRKNKENKKSTMSSDEKSVSNEEKLCSNDETLISSDEKLLSKEEKTNSSDGKLLSNDEILISSDEKLLSKEEKPNSSDGELLSTDEKNSSNNNMFGSNDNHFSNSDDKYSSCDRKCNVKKLPQRTPNNKSCQNNPSKLLQTYLISAIDLVIDFFNEKITRKDPFYDVSIVLSNNQQFGEAEHKIMDYIRQLDFSEKNNSILIYTNDTDIILLGIRSHLPNICITDGVNYLYPFNLSINMSKLFECDLYSGKKIVDDIVFIRLLLDNDYLSNFPDIGSPDFYEILMHYRVCHCFFNKIGEYSYIHDEGSTKYNIPFLKYVLMSFFQKKPDPILHIEQCEELFLKMGGPEIIESMFRSVFTVIEWTHVLFVEGITSSIVYYEYNVCPPLFMGLKYLNFLNEVKFEKSCLYKIPKQVIHFCTKPQSNLPTLIPGFDHILKSNPELLTILNSMNNSKIIFQLDIHKIAKLLNVSIKEVSVTDYEYLHTKPVDSHCIETSLVSPNNVSVSLIEPYLLSRKFVNQFVNIKSHGKDHKEFYVIDTSMRYNFLLEPSIYLTCMTIENNVIIKNESHLCYSSINVEISSSRVLNTMLFNQSIVLPSGLDGTIYDIKHNSAKVRINFPTGSYEDKIHEYVSQDSTYWLEINEAAKMIGISDEEFNSLVSIFSNEENPENHTITGFVLVNEKGILLSTEFVHRLKRKIGQIRTQSPNINTDQIIDFLIKNGHRLYLKKVGIDTLSYQTIRDISATTKDCSSIIEQNVDLKKVFINGLNNCADITKELPVGSRVTVIKNYGVANFGMHGTIITKFNNQALVLFDDQLMSNCNTLMNLNMNNLIEGNRITIIDIQNLILYRDIGGEMNSKDSFGDNKGNIH